MAHVFGQDPWRMISEWTQDQLDMVVGWLDSPFNTYGKAHWYQAQIAAAIYNVNLRKGIPRVLPEVMLYPWRKPERRKDETLEEKTERQKREWFDVMTMPIKDARTGEVIHPGRPKRERRETVAGRIR